MGADAEPGVTERSAAEGEQIRHLTLAALLESDATARAVVDAIFTSVPSGLTLASAPDVDILRVSDHGARALQRPRESLEHIAMPAHSGAYGVRSPDGRPVAPEDLPLSRATRSGEIVRDEEYKLVTEDGKLIDILCNAGPVRDSEDRIVGGIIAWTDITRHRLLESQLEASVRHREMLMQEMNHRVKNHLAILSGLARIGAKGRGAEVQEFAADIAARLEVIAKVHDQFHQAEYEAGVSARALITSIGDALRSDAHDIQVEAEPSIQLIADHAAPFGMIINEAICNCIKHASRDGGGCTINLRLARSDGDVLLEIADNGRGFPVKTTANRPGGMRLLNALAAQLGGTLTVGSNPAGGALVSLRFPSNFGQHRMPEREAPTSHGAHLTLP